MSSFRDTLRRTILGATEAHRVASAELHQSVRDAAISIEELTDGKARLELENAGESGRGSHYFLRFLDPRGVHVIDSFIVPSTGYPIQLTDANWHAIKEGRLQNRAEIEAHLTEMAANPESELVTHLGILLRSMEPELTPA